MTVSGSPHFETPVALYAAAIAYLKRIQALELKGRRAETTGSLSQRRADRERGPCNNNRHLRGNDHDADA